MKHLGRWARRGTRLLERPFSFDIENEEKWAVADWRVNCTSSSSRQRHGVLNDERGNPSTNDLPSTWTADLDGDILDRMNAQLEIRLCVSFSAFGQLHIDRTRTVQDYYGPSAPVHLYREYINYWYRIHDVHLCSWTEPHGRGLMGQRIGRRRVWFD